MKRVLFPLFFGAILTVSCAKDERGLKPQLLETSVSQAVQKADAQDPLSTTVLIKKEFLNKDLIFGGLMTELDLFPEVEDVSSELYWPYPTELVRLYFDDKFDVIRVKRSPLKPWDFKEHPAYEQEICSLKVDKKTDNGNYIVDLTSLASSLYVNFYGSKEVAFDRNSFIDAQGKVIIGDDYLSFPIGVRYSYEDSTISANLRFYLKKWVPNETFVKRPVDRRFGFFTLLSFWGIDAPYPDMENIQPEDVIIRWDLEKRTEPITYIISKDVPEKYRDTVKGAIESWNAPLKKLLNKSNDVVLARMQKEGEEVVPGDLAVNYVHWERSPYKGMAGLHASFQVDPISGEIFHSDVYIGGESLIQALTRYYGRVYEDEGKEEKKFQISVKGRKTLPTCDLKPTRGFSDSILPVKVTKDQYVKDWLFESIIHEVGHNFGLRHNFKGSLSVDIANLKKSHSVMDYIADDVITSGLAMTEPGGYDTEALSWAYLGTSQSTYSFCTDEETSLITPYYDPLCRKWDFGPNPLESLYEPAVRLYTAKMFEAQDLFGFRWNRLLALTNLKSVFQFLPERAEVADRVKVNEIVAEFLKTIQSKYMGHAKAVPALETVIKYYFETAVQNSLYEGVIQPILTDVLRGFILDMNSSQQIPVELKLNIIDSLSKFGKSSQKSNQFQAWDTLTLIRDDLVAQKGKIRGWGFQMTKEEQYKSAELDRLLELTNERLTLFFGERRQR